MNILFFLTPKLQVSYLHDKDNVRQALEKMEFHRYTALPIISKNGEYIGTITEGDLLWFIKQKKEFSLKNMENIPITQINRYRDNQPVSASAKMEDLILIAMEQNFVPVIDDRNNFIGIITRKNIIEYLYQKTEEKRPLTVSTIMANQAGGR